MANDWVKVYASNSRIDAEMVKAKLADNGIETVELNKQDSSYLAFGLVELYCVQSDVIRALHLIHLMNE
jgi:translation elongation factor EF-1beta